MITESQAHSGDASFYLHRLETQMASLENKMQKAMTHLAKKESHVNGMASDLEHIMMLLIKRMES